MRAFLGDWKKDAKLGAGAVLTALASNYATAHFPQVAQYPFVVPLAAVVGGNAIGRKFGDFGSGVKAYGWVMLSLYAYTKLMKQPIALGFGAQGADWQGAGGADWQGAGMADWQGAGALLNAGAADWEGAAALMNAGDAGDAGALLNAGEPDDNSAGLSEAFGLSS